MKKIFVWLGAGLLAFTGCNKDDGIRQLSFPECKAAVDGTVTDFGSPVTAESLQKPDGSYQLRLSAQHIIGGDSSTIITFIIPDFTRGTTRQADHTLSVNFNGNFAEKKTTATGFSMKLHYYQEGQLSVQLDDRGYLKGSFHFKYSLFDAYGNTTKQVAITNGSFSDVIIEK